MCEEMCCGLYRIESSRLLVESHERGLHVIKTFILFK